MEKLTEWGLNPKVESSQVYASRPSNISVTMTGPNTGSWR